MAQKPSSVIGGRTIGHEEPLIPSLVLVHYLCQPGEHEGGRQRATDPVWSLDYSHRSQCGSAAGQPALYYLTEGPTRGFIRKELLIVPPGTELPPDWVLTHQTAR